MTEKNKHNDLLLKKYQIKWNSFPDYLAESNKNLYDEKEFADVTLVSDDLTEVEAHKTVLSNASTVLKKLLKIKPVNHPILFLKGINGKDLDSIVQFIYLGETIIHEDRIQEFANIAEDLKIQELHDILPRIRASQSQPVIKSEIVRTEGSASIHPGEKKTQTKREYFEKKGETSTPPPMKLKQSFPIAKIKDVVETKQQKKLRNCTMDVRKVSSQASRAVKTNNLSYLSSVVKSDQLSSSGLKTLNSFFSEVKAEAAPPPVLNNSLSFLSVEAAPPSVLKNSLSFLSDARAETAEEIDDPMASSQGQSLRENQSLSFLLETQEGVSIDIPDLSQGETVNNEEHEVDFQNLMNTEASLEEETELPWNCEECHKGFLTSEELERHRGQHQAYRAHQLPSFPCDQCPKVLRKRTTLRDHKRSQHKIKTEENMFQGLKWF